MTTMNGTFRRIGADEVTDDRLFASAFDGRVRVSPERARRWLDTRNTRNRMVVKSNVRKIAESIEAGHWRDDHPNAILFDREGVLLDGQHRLMAVVEAGTPVTMKVVTGADPTIRQYLDTGRHRQVHDRVTVSDDKMVNRNCVAICAYFAGKSLPYDLDRFNEAFPAHQESVLFAARWMNERPIIKRVSNAAVAAALAKMFEVSPESAAKFAASLRQADGPIQPARVLRDFLLTRRGTFGGGKGWDVHERTIYVCHAFMCGREVRSMNKRFEEFPAFAVAE